MNAKKWKIRLIIAITTAIICCWQIPIFAQIARSIEPQTNTQLADAQNLLSAGLYRQACNSLLPILKLTDFNCQTLIDDRLSPAEQVTIAQLPNTEIAASGLRALGEVMRLTGALKTSEILLKRSLNIAQNLQLNRAIAAAYLSLGNTHRSSGKRQADLRKDTAANYAKALAYYERAIELSPIGEQLQAKLNKLSLLVENKPDFDRGNLWQEIKLQVDNLPADTAATYARIDFAETLICLKVQTRDFDIDRISLPLPPAVKQCAGFAKTKTAENPELIYIAKLLATAANDAKRLSNLRAESHAKGRLGELYEITGQISAAKQLTTEALGIAQSIQAADIAYRWQWQLGRLRVKNGGIKMGDRSLSSISSNLAIRAQRFNCSQSRRAVFFPR
ncbi:MAG: tetratricopeptide repeat protein [Microcoleus sp. SU_5_6]|nr:tetratricopeptide repeat protein [Microcoleus sp. SU_5_6]